MGRDDVLLSEGLGVIDWDVGTSCAGSGDRRDVLTRRLFELKGKVGLARRMRRFNAGIKSDILWWATPPTLRMPG